MDDLRSRRGFNKSTSVVLVRGEGGKGLSSVFLEVDLAREEVEKRRTVGAKSPVVISRCPDVNKRDRRCRACRENWSIAGTEIDIEGSVYPVGPKVFFDSQKREILSLYIYMKNNI